MRTFFARFLRSFRSLREGFSTLAASPDYWVGQSPSMARKGGESVPALDDIWAQTSSVRPHHHKSKRILCFVLHQIVFGGQMRRRDFCQSCREQRAFPEGRILRRWDAMDGGHQRQTGGEPGVGW